MGFRFARRTLFAGALLGVGCYSPTLPLPPPVKPDVSLTSTGDYELTGGVLPNSPVFALDARTQLIDGQVSDGVGLYTIVLHAAQAGDTITLWYESGTDLSPPMVFDLPTVNPSGSSGGAAGTAATGGSGGAGTSGSGGMSGSGG
ncbi:MAG TPA: hypothetical protein VMI54_02445 [Polyangiaceae bacterium]|nr:hypothetical protein [Polyangiaceae bacterium]